MRTLCRLLLIIGTLGLAACANNMSNDQLNNLQYGLTPATVATVTANPTHRQFSLVVRGKPILVQIYTLASGDYLSDYFLAYKNNRLLFWGYPNEYARSKSQLIRAIGQRAVARWQSIK